MIKAQDIHQTDGTLLKEVEQLWNQESYEAALSLLQSSQLATKRLDAETINTIQDWLMTLQENEDPTFKADKIKVSTTPPIDLGVNEIYFQAN